MLSDVVNEVRVMGEDASRELLLGIIAGDSIIPAAGNADGGGVRITREVETMGVLDAAEDDDDDDDDDKGTRCC